MNTDNIRLIHGDFYSEYRNFEPGSFDLILTDPPYNRLQQAGQEWDVKIDWDRTEGIFSRLLKPTGWVIMFCDFLLAVELTNTFKHKLEYHGLHLWKKYGGAIGNKNHVINDSEHILIFRPKGVRVSEMTFNPKSILPPGEPYKKRNSSDTFSTRRQKKSPLNQNITGERWAKTFLPEVPVILTGPSKPNMTMDERRGLSHPTIKPQAVLQPLIRCYTNPGAKILDPFGGSFSTVLAGNTVGERYITSVELDDQFFFEGKERVRKATMQGDLFHGGVNAQ